MSDVRIITADCIEFASSLEADSVELVFGSPPYSDARTYGIDAQRGCEEWVAWMLDVTTAMARISKGPVVWVAAGVTRDRNYWPACEGLMWEWWKRGGTHQLYRPCVFHRVGIPGSGGKDWFRADWEYVMCFKQPGKLAWSDNTACGHPPKWAPGGEMSHRMSNGARVNQWGGTDGDPNARHGSRTAAGARTKRFRPSHRQHTKRRADGEMKEQKYVVPTLANPGNAVEKTYTTTEVEAILAKYESGDWQHMDVGGGRMGDKLAHENEAPFPEALAAFFIRSLCPEGGIVLDPFSGSGTTIAVARKWGRRAIGVDVRESQSEIARKRLCQEVLFT